MHRRNPTPGVIINHPDGPDVYKGVPKDYTKEVSLFLCRFGGHMFVEVCLTDQRHDWRYLVCSAYEFQK